MDWMKLEQKVRNIAEMRWKVAAKAEHIAGVDYDCVLHLDSEQVVVIEITKNDKVEKVRSDINNRLVHIRDYYNRQNVFARCYMVTEKEPTSSAKKYALEKKVHIKSFEDFESEFLKYKHYFEIRKNSNFGSAINPHTGKNDQHRYIPVRYFSKNESYTIEDIIKLLNQKRKVILLGDYGVGKSRCIKEVFNEMNSETILRKSYTFCVNLRDNWGLKRKSEIISRHFEDLGMREFIDPVIQISSKDNCCFLLDGFDEIGTQSWSSQSIRLKASRKEALEGVAQVIKECEGGVLITGREQYFNSNEEMLECLGLTHKNPLILRCPSEFDDLQMSEYIKEEMPELIDIVPPWLPKRPLLYNILLGLKEGELDEVIDYKTSHKKYWDILLKSICEREARIKESALDGEIIKNILLEVAHIARMKSSPIGPISIEELNKIFEQLTSMSASSESAIILQRLPGLGRLSSENPNRVFTDSFILDGLRGSHLIKSIEEHNAEIRKENWNYPLEEIGLRIAVEHMQEDTFKYESYIKQSNGAVNGMLLGDLASIVADCKEEMDFKNLCIKDAEIFNLNCSGKISNLSIDNCIIHSLDLTNSQAINISITRSSIKTVYGVGNESGLPSWIAECRVENFPNTSKMKTSQNLKPSQKVLMSVIQKIYFQAGGGRLEDALFRGFSDKERNLIPPIMDTLLKMKLVSTTKDGARTIYNPVRKEKNRFIEMRQMLTMSNDPLWLEVSKID